MNINIFIYTFYFRTFNANHAIMANVWGAKYHEAEEGTRKLWRLVMAKNYQPDHAKFEQFMAKHSGLDSGFRIRRKALWTGFVQHQEDLMQEGNNKIKFTMAENIGLQESILKIGDRSTERYVFDSHTILNSKGKRLEFVDVVFHSTLSLKMNAPPLLKPITMKPASREVFADVIRVSTPGSNFYSCQLALAGGMALFHGRMVRKVTSGQLPVVRVTQQIDLKIHPTHISHLISSK